MSMMVSPFAFGAAGPSWTAASLPNVRFQADVNYSNYTMRNRIKTSILPAGTRNLLRFTVHSGPSQGLVITKCYVGLAGAGTYDFSTTPTQAFFGGSAGFTIGTDTTSPYCDPVTLTIPGGSDVMVALYTASGNSAADDYYVSAVDSTNFNSGYKLGDDATTVTTSGYTQTGTGPRCYFANFEVSP